MRGARCQVHGVGYPLYQIFNGHVLAIGNQVGSSVADAVLCHVHQRINKIVDVEWVIKSLAVAEDRKTTSSNPPKDHPIYQRFYNSLACVTPEMAVEEVKRHEQMGIDAIYMGNRDLVAKYILPEFK